MAKSPIDAVVSTEIFRRDTTLVLAKRRDLASLSAVRLKFKAGGYLAGTVLAFNSAAGLHDDYAAASGGGATAEKILFESVTEAELGATGGALARALDGGFVYKTALVSYNATAKGQPGANEQIDATGVTIVKF